MDDAVRNEPVRLPMHDDKHRMEIDGPLIIKSESDRLCKQEKITV